MSVLFFALYLENIFSEMTVCDGPGMVAEFLSPAVWVEGPD